MTPSAGSDREAPVFDGAVLAGMFGSEEGVIAAVLKTFVASMADSIAELEVAGQDANPASIAELSHRIKGAARMSGALALASAAQDLEQVARRQSMERCRQPLADVVQQWLLVREHEALRAATGPR